MAGSLGGNRYKMHENLLGIIKDDFIIEDEQGQKVFDVDGKALRLRDTLDFKDMQGRVLCTIQARPIRLRETMAITRDGQALAVVHRARLAPLRERYSVDLSGSGVSWEVQGTITDHEHEIKQGGQKIAEISKRFLPMRDHYTVDMASGQNDALILAVAVCIDQMRD